MSDLHAKVAFVVATKDRPEDLRRMLASLRAQSRQPDQVVVVDASREPVDVVVREFPELNPRYVRHAQPSAARQRNVGIGAVDPTAELLGFLDDDIVMAPDALASMLGFWAVATPSLGGCAFNLMNPAQTGGQRAKRSAFARWLGLYSDRPGMVTRSGWQTLTGTVAQTLKVEWLPSTACLWRREVLADHRFDEFFAGYSYLEDLDMSYGASKTWELAIVADARYWHYPSPGGRVNAIEFGMVEVRNRFHIVRKYGLSVWRCALGVAIRLMMTLGTATRGCDRAAFQRAIGNCKGAARAAFAGERRGRG
jgi:GT2 family glycosyltransferase